MADDSKQSDDEEVSIDFSKIKGFFKKKVPAKENKEKPAGEAQKEDVSIIEQKEPEDKPKDNPKEESDDEISIDFSKIKNPFKRKAEEKQSKLPEEVKATDSKEEKSAGDKDSDDEVSIDFSKIKSFFKKSSEKLEDSSKTEEKDDEISIDFSKAKNLFKGKSEKTNKTDFDKQNDKSSEKLREILTAREEDNPDEEKVDVSHLKRAFNLKKLSGVLKTDSDTEDDIDKKPIAERKSYDKPSQDENVLPEAKKIFSNIWSKRHLVVPVFLLLIVMFIAVDIRMQNNNVPMTKSLAEQAYNNYHYNRIQEEISREFPNLPDVNRVEIVSQRLDKFYTENRAQVAEDKRQISRTFLETFLDESGRMYMPDIDTYYWMRYAQNILDHGYPGDSKEGKLNIDKLMLAPLYFEIVPADYFHSYFLAYFHKFISVFSPNINLMHSMMYYPLFIVALSMIPIFLMARKFGGNIAGLAASLLLAVNTMFVSKTLFGHADSDAWVVFFSLYAAWFLLEALTAKKFISSIIFAALSGLFVGIFTYAWSGWWYIFDFLLFALVATIFVSAFIYLVRNKSLKGYVKEPSTKNMLLSLLIFVAVSGVVSSTSIGWAEFAKTPINPLSFSQLKDSVSVTNLWPNVYVTVAELQEGSLGDIIGQLGGKVYFFIGMLGLIFILLRNPEKKEGVFALVSVLWYFVLMLEQVLALPIFIYLILLGIPLAVWVLFFSDSKKILEFEFAMLLLLWIVSGLYASTKGIRFTLIVAPAFALAFGIAVSWVVDYFSRMLHKEFNLSRVISSIVLIAVVSLLFIKPVMDSYSAAVVDTPIVNDAWYNTLTKIKLNTSQDAIITSWWDFGHQFKALANRRVTFDGSTQSFPPAHYVGKALLTNDENLSVGLLRMLNCGSDLAFVHLDADLKDIAKSIDVIDNIVVMNRDDAIDYLRENGVSENAIVSVVNYTHCKPVQNLFITSEDMVSKAGVWGHFGGWDFDKALANSKIKSEEFTDIDEGIQFLQERFGYSDEEVERVYFEILNLKPEDAGNWISPWPVYARPVGCSELSSDLIRCENFLVNLSSYDVSIPTPAGVMKPKVAVFPVEKGYVVKEYNGTATLQNGRPLGIAIIPGDNYYMIVSDYVLADSMFTKLFFLDGHGLSHYKKFSLQTTLLQNKIVVWNVDWEGKDVSYVQWKAEPLPIADANSNVSMNSNSSINVSNSSVLEDNVDAEDITSSEVQNATS